MKNTKKVLSLALAGAVVFGSMGTSFAAMPEMTKDTDKKVVEAVERLSAFGIVNGMDDGKYHEEMKVTREQFAKIIVEALGLGNAAAAANGSTNFNDVESSRWSSGYINVAVGQGLIKGYPDGTFKPAAEVSYAEAVTMLVRGLGYKDEFLSGSWPGNYVAKAAEVKITDDVKFTSATGKADRGAVALLVDNTLDAKVITVNSYEGGTVKYGLSDKTLLADKLEITEKEDLRLVGNQTLDSSIDSDELRFVETKGSTPAKLDLDMVNGVNSDELMGLKVKVYVNDDNEVMFMQRDGNEDVVVDAIKTVTVTGSGSSATTDVELLEKDDTYKATGATTYVVGDSNALANNLVGKFVIEGNEVVFASLIKAETTMVVKSIDADTKEIKGSVETSEDETVNLKDDFDKFQIKNVDGKELKLEDIKANDVVYVAKTKIEGDDVAVVTVVQNNTVEGKLTKVKSDKIEIDDKEYKVSTGYANATFSVDKGEEIIAYNQNDTKLEDADDATITAVKDMIGRVLYFSTDVKSTSDDIYGIVTRDYTDKDRVKMYIPAKDEEVTYTPEEESDIANLVKGDFVKFSLNKDGEMAKGEVVESTKTVTIAANTELGKSTITAQVNGATATALAVTDKSILVSEKNVLTDGETDDVSLVKWEDVKEDKIGGTVVTAPAFISDKGEIEAIVFLNDGISSATDSTEAAYVIDKWKKGSDTFVKVALTNGEVKEYELDSNSTVTDENGYVVEVKSNGKLATATDAKFTTVTGRVYDKDGDYVQVYTDTNNDKEWSTGETVDSTYYRVNNDTVIYKEADKKRYSNVTKNTDIEMIVESGKEIRVIEMK